MPWKGLCICLMCIVLFGCGGGTPAAPPTQQPDSTPVVFSAVTDAPADENTPSATATIDSLPTAAQPTPTAEQTPVSVDAVEAAGTAVSWENAAVHAEGTGRSPLAVSSGGSIRLVGGTVAAADATVPCIDASGDASVTLIGVTLSTPFSRIAVFDGGNSTLSAVRQVLAGEVLLCNSAALSVHLDEGSVFTGTFRAEGEATVNLTLSTDSVWSVTGETTVGALKNADVRMGNIRSNGFTVYYNAELAENAYLNGNGFLLDGGGFLTPMI